MEEVYNDVELQMQLQRQLLDLTYVKSNIIPLLFQVRTEGRSFSLNERTRSRMRVKEKGWNDVSSLSSSLR